MQQQREYTYAGKIPSKTNDLLFLVIGIVGALISLFGLFQAPSQAFFVIGSSCLLLTALYFKLVFFIALQMILIAGHGAILLGIGSTLQLVLPVLLCLQLLVFYFLSGQLNHISIVVGIIGIAVLSIGLAYENQWIFFTGGSAVAFYAFCNSAKKKVSLLWAILNSLFALIAIVKIYIHWN